MEDDIQLSNKRNTWLLSRCIICKYFNGVEYGTCKAFPDGVPNKFNGKNPDWRNAKHTNIEEGQNGDFVFTEE